MKCSVFSRSHFRPIGKANSMSKRFRQRGRLEKSLRKRNRGLLVWNEKQPSSLGSDASNVANPQVDSTRSGSWFGRMAEQSSTAGYELKDLIEISGQHMPINFSSRKNSFTTDIDDVLTVVASDRNHRSGTVDFTTVHAGARSKCKSLRCRSSARV